jgi:hypothetical protein
VKLADNIGSIGAKITVIKSDGSLLRRDFASDEGLRSDQSHIQIFGLGDSDAKQVSVRYIDGRVDVETGDFVNTLVTF